MAQRAVILVFCLSLTQADAQRAAVISPEVRPDRRVTFRLRAPEATRVGVVRLAHSPSQGMRDGVTLLMTRQGDIWSATSEPLTPDIYTYQFHIDGQTQNDPSNSMFVEEFSGDQTSKFSIPGVLWTDKGAPAGAFSRHKYQSSILGGDEEYAVYTPPGYDARRRDPYPVLYLLHGAGDNAATWVTNGGIDITLNNLIAQRRAVPMIVVMPLGYGTAGAAQNADKFEQMLLREIIPRIEQTYHVSREAVKRAIAGVSMGGGQAASIGLRHPETFSAVGLFSAARPLDVQALPLDPSRLKLVFITCGTEDVVWSDAGQQLAAALKGKGIRVVATEAKALGHVWPVWRRGAADFFQLVFQDDARAPAR
jgi:enterochelin esterase-like enzyme